MCPNEGDIISTELEGGTGWREVMMINGRISDGGTELLKEPICMLSALRRTSVKYALHLLLSIAYNITYGS